MPRRIYGHTDGTKTDKNGIQFRMGKGAHGTYFNTDKAGTVHVNGKEAKSSEMTIVNKNI